MPKIKALLRPSAPCFYPPLHLLPFTAGIMGVFEILNMNLSFPLQHYPLCKEVKRALIWLRLAALFKSFRFGMPQFLLLLSYLIPLLFHVTQCDMARLCDVTLVCHDTLFISLNKSFIINIC